MLIWQQATFDSRTDYDDTVLKYSGIISQPNLQKNVEMLIYIKMHFKVSNEFYESRAVMHLNFFFFYN